MKRRKIGIKGILKLAADSEKMFDYNDSLSKIVKEDYTYSGVELTDSQLSFAMGGVKKPEPKVEKKEIKKEDNKL